MFKWILHKVKGQCELLRIQYEEQPGYSRTQRTGQLVVGIVFLPLSLSLLLSLSLPLSLFLFRLFSCYDIMTLVRHFGS